MTRADLIALLETAEKQDRNASLAIANAARERVMTLLPDILAALRDVATHRRPLPAPLRVVGG